MAHGFKFAKRALLLIIFLILLSFSLSSENVKTVFAQNTSDTTRPVITALSVLPSNPLVGDTVTITVNATDNVKVTTIYIFVDGINTKICANLISGVNTCSYSTTYSAAGTHNYFVSVYDSSSNFARTPSSGTYSFTVSSSSGADTTPPTVSAISPTNVVTGVLTNFTVTATDNTIVYSCNIIWNGLKERNPMTKGGGSTWWIVLKPNATGTGWAQAYCYDGQNLGYGPNTTLTVFDTSYLVKLTTNGRSESPSWALNANRIVYRSQNGGLWIMDSAGTGNRQITTDFYDAHPAISPDGTKVLFRHGLVPPLGNTAEIWQVNSDGTGQKAIITDHLAKWPSWSADGTKIAYTLNENVYFANADGSGATQLTTAPTNQADQMPSWSPDGGKIIFSRSQQPYWDLYTINIDGTGLTKLPRPAGLTYAWAPKYSPDGSKIAFFGDTSGGSSDIYVMNSDGTGQIQFTAVQNYMEQFPTWSPDGAKLAYDGGSGTGSDIYIKTFSAPSGTDTVPPTVSSVSPLYAIAGTPTTFTITAIDETTVSACQMTWSFYSNIQVSFSMTKESGSTWSVVITPNATSTAIARAYCSDGTNVGYGQNTTIAINPSTDTTPPNVTVSHTPLNPAIGENIVVASVANDNVKLDHVEIYVDNVLNVNCPMTRPEGGCTGAASYRVAGTHAYYAKAFDSSGNIGTSATKSFTVGSVNNTTITPIIGPIVPTIAPVNVTTNFTTGIGSSIALSCSLLWDGALQSAMTPEIGTALQTYLSNVFFTPNTTGNHIAQVSCSDNSGNIWYGPNTTVTVATPPSTVSTQLTTDGKSSQPSWALNANKIAYGSDFYGIWIMNSDGSGKKQLTTAYDDSTPAISSDGTKILFNKGGTGIWQIDAAGTGLKNIIPWNYAFHPAWSADGKKIAFAKYGNIYLANSDGTGITQLTTGSTYGADDMPSWSPDGKKIIFASGGKSRTSFTDPSSWDIYTINVDGSGLARLTTDTASDTLPEFSPDGTKIAFTSDRGGNADIWIMNADGTNQVPLTADSQTYDFYPAWSPDSKSVAYTVSSWNSGRNIFVKSIDNAAVPVGPTTPSIGAVTPLSAILNNPTNFTASVSNDPAGTPCYFYWDGSVQSNMQNSGSIRWTLFTPNTTGSHALGIGCTDSTTGVRYGAVRNVIVNSTETLSDNDRDGIPDIKDNCPIVSNPKQENFDGDSQGDACDSDIDNDGIPNEYDYIVGDQSKMSSNIGIKIKINNTSDFFRVFNGTIPIDFISDKDNKFKVRFNFTFSGSKHMDFSNITFKDQDIRGVKGILVKGVILTGPEETKSVYLDTVKKSNKVCIKDAELNDLNDMTAACTGESEKILVCDGTAQTGGYTCTIVNGTQYLVTGLHYSGVIEYAPTGAVVAKSTGTAITIAIIVIFGVFLFNSWRNKKF